jgi:hypothetical protein
MAYFQTKNPNLGIFWRDLQRKMLVYFTAILYILWLFGTFPRFGMLYQEKSGSLGADGGRVTNIL